MNCQFWLSAAIILITSHHSWADQFSPLFDSTINLRCQIVLDKQTNTAFGFSLNSKEKAQALQLLARLKSRVGEVAEARTRQSFENYLAFATWSIQNDPMQYTQPNYKTKIQFMADALSEELPEAQIHQSNGWVKNRNFVVKVLKTLNELAARERPPNYEELALVADDYTMAISIAQEWKGGGDWIGHESLALQNREGPVHEIRKRSIRGVLNLAPYFFIEHIQSASVQDFVDGFFIPEIKLGITNSLNVIDGATEGILTGEQIARLSGPRVFYIHDLNNHAFKGMSRDLIEIDANYQVSARRKPKYFLTYLETILDQLDFHLEISNLRRTLSPEQNDTLSGILFYLFHERPEDQPNGNSRFLKHVLKQAILNPNTFNIVGKKMSMRERMIESLPGILTSENTFGEDLPHIKDKSVEEIRALVDNVLTLLLNM